jgi:Mrp family chromosome partitioning ATPase
MMMYSVGRDQGILLREEMEYVDRVVIETIKPALVARQIMPLTKVSDDGGVMWVTTPEEVDMSDASITLHGAAQADDITL